MWMPNCRPYGFQSTSVRVPTIVPDSLKLPASFDSFIMAGGPHLDFEMWETMNFNPPPFLPEGGETIAPDGA